MKRLVLFIVILAGFATLALGDNTPPPKKPKAQPSLFVSFKAVPLGDSVHLRFVTSNETKVRRFAVMANNGKEWYEAGSVSPTNGGIGGSYLVIYQGQSQKFQIAEVDSSGAVHLSHEETLGSYTEPGVSIYPNPTTGIVYVNTEGSGSVVVYDIEGNLLSKDYWRVPPYKANLSRFKNGSYLVVVTNAEGIIQASKVIIKED